MTPKPPESSFLDLPHKVEGSPKEARESFYEFAKDKIKYLTQEEIEEWRNRVAKITGREIDIPAATAIISFKEEKNFGKWIHNLEIIVNKDSFNIGGKDYSDLMPFVLEHEIYEAWLNAKKGTASTIDEKKQHILAHRRSFLLAEQHGLGDKFLEWFKSIDPDNSQNIKQCEYALRVARKQLHKK